MSPMDFTGYTSLTVNSGGSITGTADGSWERDDFYPLHAVEQEARRFYRETAAFLGLPHWRVRYAEFWAAHAGRSWAAVRADLEQAVRLVRSWVPLPPVRRGGHSRRRRWFCGRWRR